MAPEPVRAALRRVRRALSRRLRPALDPRAAPGPLGRHELRALRAFTEAAVAAAPLDEEAWAPVRDFLDEAARTRPGYRALCRAACRLLDELGPGSFAALPLPERTRRIELARLAERPVGRRELLWVAATALPAGRRRARLALRELLLPDLIAIHYESPAGWAVVGYEAALGECRDAWGYTRRPP